MNKERFEKLTEAKDKLKNDFVGLDEIIDKIIDSITPWYLTPEIMERPTVVSLWGLTGTGKTSLVRKLVSYLGISDKTLFFDCGEQGGETDTKLFSEKLDELFESSQIREDDKRYSGKELKDLGINLEGPKVISRIDPLDYTFVFDEFQYLHTKSPNSGEEENRPEGRAIWGLMDSGLVDISRYNYRVRQLLDYIEDLECFSEEHPGIRINEGRFEKSYNSLLRQQLSYYRWASVEDDEDEDEDQQKGYQLIMNDDFGFLTKRLNLLQKGLGFEVGDKINTFRTLQEFIEYIKGYINLVSRPKVINCSKALVFILGNLDEAFDLTGDDLDPDIDADVYHETTSKVNCIEIKTALRKRFRDEQIGRMGNNLIIYPSLRRCDFEEIISREITRIKNKFKETSGRDIIISEDFKKLIYSEGCFPIQGVRPLFSTINTLTSPLLSIIVMSPEKKGGEKYILTPKTTDFNVPKIILQVKTERGEIIGEKEVSLNLGALRSPERCKKLGLQAIHEASHAVLYHLLTGKYPSAIVASNVFGDGGYMMNASTSDYSVDNIHDLRVDVIVSLAGYYGEREFFDPDMCSLGATSDINSVWEWVRNAFYKAGLIKPLKYSEVNVSIENEGLPFGFSADTHHLEIDIDLYFTDLCNETKKLIHQEREAIRVVARELCKTRSLGIDVFKGIIKETLTVTPETPKDDYYIKIINNEE